MTVALLQQHYAAVSEHAYRERISVGELVRRALEEKGYFQMPGPPAMSTSPTTTPSAEAISR